MITVYYEGCKINGCSSVIIIPKIAEEEPGFIQTLTAKNTASSKHEFHTMAQMAYFQLQDDELEYVEVTGDVLVESGGDGDTLLSGMIVYRDYSDGFHVLAHKGVNIKKLLEVAYRYCTRWIRMDI